MTVPSDNEFDPQTHLCVGDIALDDSRCPSMVRVTIKQSKTDPFNKGIVGRTGTELCPVAALLDYLDVRGSTPGPLFIFVNGRLLTRQRFVDRIRAAMEKVSVDQSKYCGHSFRIGAATTQKRGGGLCYQDAGTVGEPSILAVVKLPRDQLSAYSMILAS